MMIEESENSRNSERHPNDIDIIINEKNNIISADIYTWKLKKSHDGVIYAAYCIHVTLKSGFRWLIEKRYTEFRELRNEIRRVYPELPDLTFPKKMWIFNLSKSSLAYRQSMLNTYLHSLIAIAPQPLELAIFLEVEVNVAGLRLSGGSLALRKSSSGVNSVQALLTLRMSQHNYSNAVMGLAGLDGMLSIEDFQLIKVLGKGSFGKVFLVKPVNPPYNQDVYAMKVLRKGEVVKRHQIEHTLTERAILAQINHPFILALRYAFQTKHKLYMITDYCPGGELFFHLKKLRRFTEGMMRFYVSQISLALAHLHRHSIIYRDLKPENVLLDQNGNIKLTDFGLSKRVTSFELGTVESSTATFCGTPEYLSPEMVLHRKSGSGYSKEVDWWALGIVCFELLVGWPPFYDKDFNKMCEKILYKPVSFPIKKYNTTVEAELLVRGLLNRDSSKRLLYENNLLEHEYDTNNKKALHRNLRYHAFFVNVDWAAMEAGLLVPPFVPPIGKDICDTRNFEREFTKLKVQDSPVASISESVADENIATLDLNKFAGFSFCESINRSTSDSTTMSSKDDSNKRNNAASHTQNIQVNDNVHINSEIIRTNVSLSDTENNVNIDKYNMVTNNNSDYLDRTPSSPLPVVNEFNICERIIAH